MRWHTHKSAATSVLAALLLAGLGGLAGSGRPTTVAAPAPLPREERLRGTWALGGVCSRHEAIVMAVALSRDGKLAVSAGEDQTLRFWDTASGKQVRKVVLAPWVGAVRFSPAGNQLATTAHQSVRFWAPQTGKEAAPRLSVEQPGYALAFSPDGSRLAVGAGRRAQVWDVRRGRKLADFSFEKNSIAQVWSIAFSPDGARLAVALQGQGGDEDGVPLVRVLEVKSGKAVFTAWPRGTVNAVAFSPDGKVLVAGGALPEGEDEDGALQGWELAANKLLYKVRPDKHGLFCLAFSPDGKTLATGGTGPAIKLWDGRTGARLGTLARHTDQVHALAFSADGKVLASAGRDRLVAIWRLRPGP
jgi:WD40 repeat protein